jgi:hypothetical protein
VTPLWEQEEGLKVESPGLGTSLSRQMLHASHLAFTHPRTQIRLEFNSPCPPDMSQLIDLLKKS